MAPSTGFPILKKLSAASPSIVTEAKPRTKVIAAKAETRVLIPVADPVSRLSSGEGAGAGERFLPSPVAVLSELSSAAARG